MGGLLQLPASFFAYRKQQHRWTCGPVQLWRKASSDIWNSSLPMARKLELICCYFGIRKFATHWVSLGFFCGLVPLSVFTPEVSCHISSQGLTFLVCVPHFAHYTSIICNQHCMDLPGGQIWMPSLCMTCRER